MERFPWLCGTCVKANQGLAGGAATLEAAGAAEGAAAGTGAAGAGATAIGAAGCSAGTSFFNRSLLISTPDSSLVLVA